MGLMPKMGETRLNIFQQLTTKKPVCEGSDELLGYKKQQLYPLYELSKSSASGRARETVGRTRIFPEIWPENMRRGESEIYFTAIPRERMVVNQSGHVHYGRELNTFQNMYVSRQKLDMVTNRLM